MNTGSNVLTDPVCSPQSKNEQQQQQGCSDNSRDGTLNHSTPSPAATQSLLEAVRRYLLKRNCGNFGAAAAAAGGDNDDGTTAILSSISLAEVCLMECILHVRLQPETMPVRPATYCSTNDQATGTFPSNWKRTEELNSGEGNYHHRHHPSYHHFYPQPQPLFTHTESMDGKDDSTALNLQTCKHGDNLFSTPLSSPPAEVRFQSLATAVAATTSATLSTPQPQSLPWQPAAMTFHDGDTEALGDGMRMVTPIDGAEEQQQQQQASNEEISPGQGRNRNTLVSQLNPPAAECPSGEARPIRSAPNDLEAVHVGTSRATAAGIIRRLSQSEVTAGISSWPSLIMQYAFLSELAKQEVGAEASAVDPLSAIPGGSSRGLRGVSELLCSLYTLPNGKYFGSSGHEDPVAATKATATTGATATAAAATASPVTNSPQFPTFADALEKEDGLSLLFGRLYNALHYTILPVPSREAKLSSLSLKDVKGSVNSNSSNLGGKDGATVLAEPRQSQRLVSLLWPSFSRLYLLQLMQRRATGDGARDGESEEEGLVLSASNAVDIFLKKMMQAVLDSFAPAGAAALPPNLNAYQKLKECPLVLVPAASSHEGLQNCSTGPRRQKAAVEATHPPLVSWRSCNVAIRQLLSEVLQLSPSPTTACAALYTTPLVVGVLRRYSGNKEKDKPLQLRLVPATELLEAATSSPRASGSRNSKRSSSADTTSAGLSPFFYNALLLEITGADTLHLPSVVSATTEALVASELGREHSDVVSLAEEEVAKHVYSSEIPPVQRRAAIATVVRRTQSPGRLGSCRRLSRRQLVFWQSVLSCCHFIYVRGTPEEVESTARYVALSICNRREERKCHQQQRMKSKSAAAADRLSAMQQDLVPPVDFAAGGVSVPAFFFSFASVPAATTMMTAMMKARSPDTAAGNNTNNGSSGKSAGSGVGLSRLLGYLPSIATATTTPLEQQRADASVDDPQTEERRLTMEWMYDILIPLFFETSHATRPFVTCGNPTMPTGKSRDQQQQESASPPDVEWNRKEHLKGSSSNGASGGGRESVSRQRGKLWWRRSLIGRVQAIDEAMIRSSGVCVEDMASPSASIAIHSKDVAALRYILLQQLFFQPGISVESPLGKQDDIEEEVADLFGASVEQERPDLCPPSTSISTLFGAKVATGVALRVAANCNGASPHSAGDAPASPHLKRRVSFKGDEPETEEVALPSLFPNSASSPVSSPVNADTDGIEGACNSTHSNSLAEASRSASTSLPSIRSILKSGRRYKVEKLVHSSAPACSVAPFRSLLIWRWLAAANLPGSIGTSRISTPASTGIEDSPEVGERSSTPLLYVGVSSEVYMRQVPLLAVGLASDVAMAVILSTINAECHHCSASLGNEEGDSKAVALPVEPDTDAVAQALLRSSDVLSLATDAALSFIPAALAPLLQVSDVTAKAPPPLYQGVSPTSLAAVGGAAAAAAAGAGNLFTATSWSSYPSAPFAATDKGDLSFVGSAGVSALTPSMAVETALRLQNAQVLWLMETEKAVLIGVKQPVEVVLQRIAFTLARVRLGALCQPLTAFIQSQLATTRKGSLLHSWEAQQGLRHHMERVVVEYEQCLLLPHVLKLDTSPPKKSLIVPSSSPPPLATAGSPLPNTPTTVSASQELSSTSGSGVVVRQNLGKITRSAPFHFEFGFRTSSLTLLEEAIEEWNCTIADNSKEHGSTTDATVSSSITATTTAATKTPTATAAARIRTLGTAALNLVAAIGGSSTSPASFSLFSSNHHHGDTAERGPLADMAEAAISPLFHSIAPRSSGGRDLAIFTEFSSPKAAHLSAERSSFLTYHPFMLRGNTGSASSPYMKSAAAALGAQSSAFADSNDGGNLGAKDAKSTEEQDGTDESHPQPQRILHTGDVVESRLIQPYVADVKRLLLASLFRNWVLPWWEAVAEEKAPMTPLNQTPLQHPKSRREASLDSPYSVNDAYSGKSTAQQKDEIAVLQNRIHGAKKLNDELQATCKLLSRVSRQFELSLLLRRPPMGIDTTEAVPGDVPDAHKNDAEVADDQPSLHGATAAAACHDSSTLCSEVQPDGGTGHAEKDTQEPTASSPGALTPEELYYGQFESGRKQIAQLCFLMNRVLTDSDEGSAVVGDPGAGAIATNPLQLFTPSGSFMSGGFQGPACPSPLNVGLDGARRYSAASRGPSEVFAPLDPLLYRSNAGYTFASLSAATAGQSTQGIGGFVTTATNTTAVTPSSVSTPSLDRIVLHPPSGSRSPVVASNEAQNADSIHTLSGISLLPAPEPSDSCAIPMSSEGSCTIPSAFATRRGEAAIHMASTIEMPMSVLASLVPPIATIPASSSSNTATVSQQQPFPPSDTAATVPVGSPPAQQPVAQSCPSGSPENSTGSDESWRNGGYLSRHVSWKSKQSRTSLLNSRHTDDAAEAFNSDVDAPKPSHGSARETGSDARSIRSGGQRAIILSVPPERTHASGSGSGGMSPPLGVAVMVPPTSTRALDICHSAGGGGGRDTVRALRDHTWSPCSHDRGSSSFFSHSDLQRRAHGSQSSVSSLTSPRRLHSTSRGLQLDMDDEAANQRSEVDIGAAVTSGLAPLERSPVRTEAVVTALADLQYRLVESNSNAMTLREQVEQAAAELHRKDTELDLLRCRVAELEASERGVLAEYSALQLQKEELMSRFTTPASAVIAAPVVRRDEGIMAVANQRPKASQTTFSPVSTAPLSLSPPPPPPPPLVDTELSGRIKELEADVQNAKLRMDQWQLLLDTERHTHAISVHQLEQRLTMERRRSESLPRSRSISPVQCEAGVQTMDSGEPTPPPIDGERKAAADVTDAVATAVLAATEAGQKQKEYMEHRITHLEAEVKRYTIDLQEAKEAAAAQQRQISESRMDTALQEAQVRRLQQRIADMEEELQAMQARARQAAQVMQEEHQTQMLAQRQTSQRQLHELDEEYATDVTRLRVQLRAVHQQLGDVKEQMHEAASQRGVAQRQQTERVIQGMQRWYHAQLVMELEWREAQQAILDDCWALLQARLAAAESTPAPAAPPCRQSVATETVKHSAARQKTTQTTGPTTANATSQTPRLPRPIASPAESLIAPLPQPPQLLLSPFPEASITLSMEDPLGLRYELRRREQHVQALQETVAQLEALRQVDHQSIETLKSLLHSRSGNHHNGTEQFYSPLRSIEQSNRNTHSSTHSPWRMQELAARMATPLSLRQRKPVSAYLQGSYGGILQDPEP